ncbi:TIGR00282 family metallophosphoesterase [bacterium]|nr:TIGR00282 family metallophosphoesterase [bacterium]
MRVLMIGDVVGKAGRKAVAALFPALREEHGIDFFIANVENSAGGKGITKETLDELFAAGVNVATAGDHVFQNKGYGAIIGDARVVRPLNYPPGAPGHGWTVVPTAQGVPVAVVNLLGRTFMKPVDCPFAAAEKALEALAGTAAVCIVDMHAEATSEKVAMGWFLDGRVTAVCGTHTHVQTADERVLPSGTAYITDLGMTGPYASVIGRGKDAVIAHFVTCLPQRFEVAEHDVRLCGAVIDIDEQTGRARGIIRVQSALP